MEIFSFVLMKPGFFVRGIQFQSRMTPQPRIVEQERPTRREGGGPGCCAVRVDHLPGGREGRPEAGGEPEEVGLDRHNQSDTPLALAPDREWWKWPHRNTVSRESRDGGTLAPLAADDDHHPYRAVSAGIPGWCRQTPG
jgi:hypothetical protein